MKDTDKYKMEVNALNNTNYTLTEKIKEIQEDNC